MHSNPHDGDSVWDCRYLVAWVTRYHYQVLVDDIGQRCYEVLRETARARELLVHAGSISKDHVRLLLSIPPTLSVFRAVRHLKACSSYQLLSEFEDLRKRYRGKHVWARGYWVASSSEASNETLAEYINSQSSGG
jgi:putative transposase